MAAGGSVYRNLRGGKEENGGVELNGKAAKGEIGGKEDDLEKGFRKEEERVVLLVRERSLEERGEKKRDHLRMEEEEEEEYNSEYRIRQLILTISHLSPRPKTSTQRSAVKCPEHNHHRSSTFINCLLLLLLSNH